MHKQFRLLALVLLTLSIDRALARGVSPYLPLNLDPEVERQVERVLILADKPVMTRPIPAGLVLDALPKACKVDAVLCEHVRHFLKNYMKETGIGFASLEGSASSGKADPIMPLRHGETTDSHYELAGMAYFQPSDYWMVSAGGVAYQDRITPTGSMLSLGFDWAQIDLGYRDHWWSPMTDSSMLISTEAPTMPSVTLSNWRPLGGLGFQYEVFLARMSETDKIAVPVDVNGTTVFENTRGYPKFAGLHLQIEPVNGWALALNRVLVFGGGAAGGQSFKDVLNAFFNPSKAQSGGAGDAASTVGKQEASFTSRFIFPAAVPFSLYFEYAANDTSRGDNYLFGKPALSEGLHLPRLGPFDVTLEHTDWERSWYFHGETGTQVAYLGGITNFGANIGNWFGDQRLFGDTPRGSSNMLRVAFEPSFGGRLEAQLRTLTNNLYAGQIYPYKREVMGSLSYAHPWRQYALGGEVDVGRDVYGDHYTRLTGFVRFGDALRSAYPESADDAYAGARDPGSELFIDVGANINRVLVDIYNTAPRYNTGYTVGPDLGFGARRQVTQNADLGVRIEGLEVRDHALLAVRALDYRYRIGRHFALGAFAGAALYEIGTPAYGWWLGGGAQWRELFPGWDLNFDYFTGIELARERTLPSDPPPPNPAQAYRTEAFYSPSGVRLYLSWKF
jgi:Capsule assembly protein Wzi